MLKKTCTESFTRNTTYIELIFLNAEPVSSKRDIAFIFEDDIQK